MEAFAISGGRTGSGGVSSGSVFFYTVATFM